MFPATFLSCRFFQVPESSGIPRMYHSSALLLPDGTVLISGSNPNAALTLTGPYPTEFRTQIFTPHYLQWGVPRNVLWKVSGGGKATARLVLHAMLLHA